MPSSEGKKQRDTIKYYLRTLPVDEAGATKPVSLGDVANLAATDASTVSMVLSGERCSGEVTERVQQVVSEILKQPIPLLFTVGK